MTTQTGSTNQLCEHGEVAVACLDCFAMPQPLAPKKKQNQRTTKSPSSDNDLIAPLTGALDMSIRVASPADVVGSKLLTTRTFPHHLRRAGWVYLRTADNLVARAKAKKVIWQIERKCLTTGDELGAGMCLEVDPTTWDETATAELGVLAEMQSQGYRYLLAGTEGEIVHYSGGKPVDMTRFEDEEEFDD